MGRKKKVTTIEEVQYKDIDLSEDKPSMSFCTSCKNSDIRVSKEAFILAMNTLYSVAKALDLIGDTSNWKGILKNLNKWTVQETKTKWNQVNKGSK